MEENIPLILNDKNRALMNDPDWIHRLSLFEMQLQDALELAFEFSLNRTRQTEAIGSLITRAIAMMVPVEDVSNKELSNILFGTSGHDDKRLVRLFRNGERPLKLNRAGLFIQNLLFHKKILPSEGGRLWYLSILYNTGSTVIAKYLRDNNGITQSDFTRDKILLTKAAFMQFDLILSTLFDKSCELPLIGYPLNDVKQFMNFSAFIYCEESKIKRNPLVSIRRLAKLSHTFNEYQFNHKN